MSVKIANMSGVKWYIGGAPWSSTLVRCCVSWCLGMSVKIANMSGVKCYIGGAPWSRYFGQVLCVVVSRYVCEDRQHVRCEVVHRWCSVVKVLWSGAVCRGV